MLRAPAGKLPLAKAAIDEVVAQHRRENTQLRFPEELHSVLVPSRRNRPLLVLAACNGETSSRLPAPWARLGGHLGALVFVDARETACNGETSSRLPAPCARLGGHLGALVFVDARENSLRTIFQPGRKILLLIFRIAALADSCGAVAALAGTVGLQACSRRGGRGQQGLDSRGSRNSHDSCSSRGLRGWSTWSNWSNLLAQRLACSSSARSYSTRAAAALRLA